MRNRIAAALMAGVLAVTGTTLVASPADAATKPVTNFKRSNAIYKVNKKSDRDKDGIACEKR
jgi:hypothetical protein